MNIAPWKMLASHGPVRTCVALIGSIFGLLWGPTTVLAQSAAGDPKPMTLVVLDPLAKELACACVKGYGQRDYRKLAALLEKDLKQRVGIEFSDDLVETLATLGVQREYIIVGERSVVAHGAKQAQLGAHPVCDLTGPDGGTTLNALFVVRADDPAKELKDIKGRTVFVGLPEADEKHAAAMQSMRTVGIAVPAMERKLPYTDAALDVLDSQETPGPVAIIPGYGMRLLQGCGSITPGDLKVIGRTELVPFVSVFVSETIAQEKEKRILEILLGVKRDPKMLAFLESRDGFQMVETEKKRSDAKPVDEPGAAANPNSVEANIPKVDWPDWRGAKRDGRVPRLPAKLPETPKVIWKKATVAGGLAGLSVRDGRLIVAERDLTDERDVYRCIDAKTGELIWRASFLAPGSLDYGQAPRATPVITESRAYLLGAFGELRCVDITNGKLLWKRELPFDFGAELPTWGMCSTPLIVRDLIIVNPGSTNASLVALNRVTGQTHWTAPGNKGVGYASFIYGKFGGREQIIGYDEKSLGGWDADTGKRLWELRPPIKGDFNVPTPMAVDDGLIVATENNGTRLYRFDDSGKIIAKPAAEFADLSPDTATPVVAGGRIFGAHLGLRCLDLHNGCKPVWHTEDKAIGDYASLIADDERVLVVTLSGELLLLDAKADTYKVLSRLRLFEEDVEVYSHPALVGTRLFIRGGSELLCVDLGTDEI